GTQNPVPATACGFDSHLGHWPRRTGAQTHSEGRDGVRIVGGTFAGRDLTSPADPRVRCTAEPVRAALLDALAAEGAGGMTIVAYALAGREGRE
ncbi:MAG TPA: RsmD family RNA methyltransferase, partial [Terriglobales bacterium]|nr:RsmD family RNA methyltransferase [Terriglobales bacterium]